MRGNFLNHRVSIWLVLGFTGSFLLAKAQRSPKAGAAADQHQVANESEAELMALSKAQPGNAEPLARLGLLEARRGNYAEAIGFYRKAIALNPAMPGLRLNLGLALFKDSRDKEALEIFDSLLRSQPPSSPEKQRLTLLVGMSHYGLGEYKAAVPYLQQAADLDPQNLSLLLTLAHSCLLSKQYQCVLDTYHRMIAQNAESAEADMLVGETLDEMDDLDGATREFRAAVKANPKEPNVHFGLGYLLWTQLQYPKAAQEFQAELDNNPGYTQAMLYLADTDIRMNHYEDARPLLESVVTLHPDIAMGHLDLGTVFAKADRKEEALREFNAAEAIKPEDVNVHMRLGRLYSSMGKGDDAKKEFDKASGLNKAAREGLVTVLSAGPERETAAPAMPHPQ
jgi:tetratricopeptide (TPR) repeat protein